MDGQTAAKPPVDQFVQSLQQKYDRVRNFSADFVQSYSGGVLRTQTSERGKVFIKKPGKMRWEYVAPEEKLFVSDGKQLYSYIPADRQVIVGDVPDEDEASTPALFLAGRGSLGRDFTAAYEALADVPAGMAAVRLTPRRPEAEFEWLTLVVDARTLELRRLISGDHQGGTSAFQFSNLKENLGLADTLFAFRPPRGTDVISSDGPRR